MFVGTGGYIGRLREKINIGERAPRRLFLGFRYRNVAQD
jgi:hypothetical protein